MTIKEAIEYAEAAPYCTGCTDGAEEKYGENCKNCPHKMFFKEAINALKKRVLKKPKPWYTISINEESLNYLCPSCGRSVDITDVGTLNFCQKCGQALDWEGIEEV